MCKKDYGTAVARLLAVGEHDKALEVARAQHTRAVWVADDGNAEAEYACATRESAAARYADGGDWNVERETWWLRLHTWRRYYVGDVIVDGDDAAVDIVAVDPAPPPCADTRGHDWRSPHELVGGLKDNPGVWGHGGGVVIHECCMRCGCRRITDTWAQCKLTGEQGLRSIAYAPGHFRDALRAYGASDEAERS